ncbi:sensor histidine kinase [Sediminivirga luteola]
MGPMIGSRRRSDSATAVRLSVATRLLLANLAMLVGIIVLFTTLIYADVSRAQMMQETERVRSSALALATSDPLREAMAAGAADDLLASTAEQFRRSSGFDRVAILSADASAAIGRADQQDEDELRPERLPQVSRAFGGETVSNYDEGLLYAASPIFGEDGQEVLGVAVVSQTESAVRGNLEPRVLWLLGVGAVALVLGGIATAITAKGLRRVTGNYGAVELGRVLDHHHSVLHAVSEGLLLVDRKEGIVLRNAEACALLGLPADDPSRPLSFEEARLPESLDALLRSGRPARDEIHYTDSHVLVVNQQSTAGLGDGGNPGSSGAGTWVVTMRDHTELQRLTGELVSVRGFSESLRSQAHEYANRLHMIVSLIETGRTAEALEFASGELEDVARPSRAGLGGFDHPVLSALLLTKMAQAHERGSRLEVRTEGLAEQPEGDDRDLVTVLGNLIDNALEAVGAIDLPAERKLVRVSISGSSVRGWTLEVADDGPGIPEDLLDDIFTRGWSTKHADAGPASWDRVTEAAGEGAGEDPAEGERRPLGRGVGLALVVQAVRRLGGAIDVRGAGEEPGDLAGAAFTVWIPGTPPAPGGNRRPGQEAARPAHAHAGQEDERSS